MKGKTIIGMMVLFVILVFGCVVAQAETSGTYHGVDWTLDDDGLLTLGNGDTQTMAGYSGRKWSSDSVISVTCRGTIVLPSSVYQFFKDYTNMVSADLSGFDMSNVTDMREMFRGCDALTSLDVSNWDTSSVTTMSSMFYGCKMLPSLNLSGWNTSNVTDMASMFYNCYKLSSLDLSGFDTVRVTNMSNMFYSCHTLTSLDLSGWNTHNVTTMQHMFHSCASLPSLNVSHFDTSAVTDMSNMFYNCENLTSLDVSSWNTSNLTNMFGLFYRCKSLTSLDVSNFDTSHVTKMGAVYSSSHRYQGSGVFEGCQGLVSLDLSSWDVSSAEGLGNMFLDCRSLTSLNISNWDTANVTDLNHMCEGCQSLTSLDVSKWNTGNVLHMCNVFDNCINLVSLDVSSWDTSNVTYMEATFYNCMAFTSLDLSDWDTSHVIYMSDDSYRRGMFMGCRNLVSLDISGWDTSNVLAQENMFTNCSRLSEITLGEKYKTSTLSRTLLLPTPPSSLGGISYTRKWVREDRTYGPFTPTTLRSDYDNATMSGKWVWEPVPTDYTLRFSSASYPGAVGEMAQVTTSAKADYQLVANRYALYGFVFDHWDDGHGHIYADQDVIPANTYNIDDVVTLNLVMKRRDTSIQMQDGEFTFTIYGDEKALFDGIPAGTSYSVFEENIPEDWVLIAQSGTTGLIYPLDESEALFVDKYQPDMATMQFTGRKLMDGQPAKANSFSFELWEGNVLLQTKSVVDGGFVQFDILEYDKFDEGVHIYVIKEMIGTDETLLYDGHEETITVEVTTEEGSDNVTRVHAEVTHSEGTYPDILFQNWTKPGELTLKKLVDDLLAGHENDEFRFRITFKQENGLPLNEDLTYSIEP